MKNKVYAITRERKLESSRETKERVKRSGRVRKQALAKLTGWATESLTFRFAPKATPLVYAITRDLRKKQEVTGTTLADRRDTPIAYGAGTGPEAVGWESGVTGAQALTLVQRRSRLTVSVARSNAVTGPGFKRCLRLVGASLAHARRLHPGRQRPRKAFSPLSYRFTSRRMMRVGGTT
ncbi:hypothetical protein NDU88_010326 [Pleurodeles waltl]|uniref:Uncharacterized protein n=1 Tax=Pleurodeles waltl TaxID=8319 RepID=A0AAV7QW24_PLEWA|nr:hypothetical protein NDU88_010326 [Pleurodeles waltl]